MPTLMVVAIDHENRVSSRAASTQPDATASPAATTDDRSSVVGVSHRTRSVRKSRANTTPATSAPMPVAP